MKVILSSFELTPIIRGEWKKHSSRITKTEKETDEEARARTRWSTNTCNFCPDRSTNIILN